MRHISPIEIHEAVEGLRPEGEIRAIEAHAAACPACGRSLAEARRFHEAAANLPDLPLPDGFTAAVMARVPAAPAKRAGFPWPVAAVAGMAVFTLAFLAGVLAAGASPTRLWLGLNASFFEALKSGALVTGKLLRLLSLSLDLAAGFVRRGADGLAVASSFLRPEGWAAIAIFLFAATALLAVGLRRKFASGDTP